MMAAMSLSSGLPVQAYTDASSITGKAIEVDCRMLSALRMSPVLSRMSPVSPSSVTASLCAHQLAPAAPRHDFSLSMVRWTCTRIWSTLRGAKRKRVHRD